MRHEHAIPFRQEVSTMSSPVTIRLSDLIAQAKQLGSAAQPEIVEWGGDVGAEIIDDAYSKPRGRLGRRARAALLRLLGKASTR
jgi:hypothetical protein